MNIIHFEKLDSTNSYAKFNIENIADKTIVSTDVQTNGYGRFERKWVDLGSENIYMSFVLKPSNKMLLTYANLTQYLSVCLCQYLETFKLSPKIKWPNDVLLNNKKVCGILAESVIKSGELKGIILGIGINLNASEEHLKEIDRPATALNIELGRNINKEKFMQELIDYFFKNYDNFLSTGFNFVKNDYIKRASFLNQRLKISVFNSIKEGLVEEIDDNGNLVLILDSGKIETFNMGEIIN